MARPCRSRPHGFDQLHLSVYSRHVPFYGIGFGLGAGVGLSLTEIIALGVFVLQMLLSRLWLHYCLFGPLEWIWRMLNYGKPLQLFKQKQRG